MNVRFSIAASRRYTDQNGQQVEKTNWFNVTAWGKTAETIDNLTQQGAIRKGTQLFVQGRLDLREYQDSNGQTRSSMDVNLDQFQLLGSRGDADGGAGGRRDFSGGDSGSYEPQDIDDIPF